MILDLHSLRLNYSIRRYFVDEYMRRQAALLPASWLVLDLGGHKVRKRGQFDINEFNVKTICLNITPEKFPDIQADGAYLPLAPDSFDAVICTEVLEHVPDPRLLIEESYRVLRPGGRFVATVPFLYRIHSDPYDFGRYTDHYWDYALRKAGFDNIQIERHGQFYAVLLDYIKQYLSRMGGESRIGTLIRRLLGLLIVFPIQPWLLQYEKQLRFTNPQFTSSFTTGFGIVATKPSQVQSAA
jgi:SAM-dependent methyltransferase